MIAELSYPTAILAGALSFLSPCVLPLVPPYLCYMAGVSADELKSGRPVRSGGYARLVLTALVFVLGFSTVFVLLGAGASTLGNLLRRNMDWLGILAGLVIIAMGLKFLGLLRLDILSREARFQPDATRRSFGGAYLMGLAFAFGWTPCIGPVLGVILGLAGTKQSVSEGMVMLALYSAGLGIPFILTAAFSGTFLRGMSRVRGHFGAIEKAMGALLVVTGVLFLTGGMQAMSFWLLETFPALQKIG